MPGPETNRARLTRRQAEILDFICRAVQSRGFPPSIREIGEAVGLSSSSTVHSHLRTLEEKAYIRRNPSKPRSIEVMDWPGSLPPRTIEVPVRPVEGSPPDEEAETLPLPVELVGAADSFLFRVESESYRREAIMPGDLLIVNPGRQARQGDMVLTRGEEDTLPQLSTCTGEPATARVLGRVVGVIRKLPAS